MARRSLRLQHCRWLPIVAIVPVVVLVLVLVLFVLILLVLVVVLSREGPATSPPLEHGAEQGVSESTTARRIRRIRGGAPKRPGYAQQFCRIETWSSKGHEACVFAGSVGA